MANRPTLHLKPGFKSQAQKPVTINRTELIHEKQSLIRSGQRQSFTYAVKPRKPRQPVERPPIESPIEPKILVAHAVHIARRTNGLRPDKLVRSIPTIDKPKPSTRKTPRRAPDSLSIAERKLFRKMKWYKPGSLT